MVSASIGRHSFFTTKMARGSRGRSGIGDIAYGDAHAAWQSGEERDWNLEKYLALPGIGSLAGSPLEKLTPTWEIRTDGEDNPFHRVRVTGENRIIFLPGNSALAPERTGRTSGPAEGFTSRNQCQSYHLQAR